MKAAVVNLIIEQGTDWSQTVKFYSDTERKVPCDLTGLTGRCKIRDSEGVQVAAPAVAITALTGTVVLSLTNAQTSAIPVEGYSYSETSTYAYDVELVDAAGFVSRWMNGSVTVSPEVTK